MRYPLIRLSLLTAFLCAAVCLRSQMRQVYVGTDENNDIKKIQFLSPAEGFVSFEKWIGYTQDSGRTFVRKYITTSNVNYNNQYVNLTFGFSISGVYAFDKNNLLAYGHYGFVPAILSSSDGGTTFSLVYLTTFNPDLYSRIEDVYFSGNTGFAVSEDKILKTTDRGRNWRQVYATTVPDLLNLNFFDASRGLVIGHNRLLKTTDGGATWQNVNKPAGFIRSGSFINEQTGWVNIETYAYKTTDGGASWTLKNDDYNQLGAVSLRFLNDSVGYAAGGLFNTVKTTDGGRYWETVQRDNNYSYLGYGHNDLFFLNPNVAWAGGGHGFLELTTNGGANTVPGAAFYADYSQLAVNNTVNLVNKTKPGYSYQWFKNRVLFATTYNASYVSNRSGIDTVQLVVIKGTLSNTAVQLVDTRANPGYACKADFTSKTDTGTVQFTATDTTAMAKHVWYFGDGAVDSSDLRVRHFYAAVGTYTVKHVVSSTVYHCADSAVQTVTIVRTQNCLLPDFTYTADSFYTNLLKFKPTFSSANESGGPAMSILSWQWGDGKPNGTQSQNSHQYDAPGYYTTCLTVQNFYTGCISKVCKPVFVSMDSTCNAAFLVQKAAFSNVMNFTGKPNSRKSTTKNTWIISGRSPVNTGANDAFEANFYTQRYGEGTYFDLAGNSCGYPYTFEIDIDSIRRTITRIVRDTVTGCTDSLKQAFTVPRLKNVYIQATVNPSFSQTYSFYAYELDSKGDTVPYSYSSRWRLSGPGSSYYAGGYNGGSNRLSYTFSDPGPHTASVAANTCSGNGREVYYISFNVTAESCPVPPPDFYTQVDTTADNTLQFLDPTLNQNLSLNNSEKWYFGDGDSSTGLFPKHTYPAPGIYNATLQYTNPNGCSKKITKAVTVTSRSCKLVANFSTSGSTKAPATVQFINKTTPDSATVSYLWHFGSLDSSTLKNPVYTFVNAGAYVVRLTASKGSGCQQSFDSLLIIQPADSCRVKAGMTAPASVTAPATVSFQNTSTGATAYAWNFGDGATSSQTAPSHVYNAPGLYNVKLIASNGACADTLQKTITVTKKPDSCTLKPQFIFAVDSASPFTVQFISTFFWRNGVKGLWDFGDGSTSTAVDPLHDFRKEGRYNVCLQVKDSACERSVCDTVVLVKPLQEPLIVYPNPAGNVLTVSYTLVIGETVNILIYSEAGRLVKRYRQASQSGTNTVPLDISDLKTGFYYVMVNTANNFNNAVRFIKL